MNSLSTQSSISNHLAEHIQVLAEIAPAGFSADRLIKLVVSACQRNKVLMNCTKESILESAQKACELGLDVNNPAGSAYLVPYQDRCQLIIGYKGLIELAVRSGIVKSIYAYTVRTGDIFEIELGTQPLIKHIPDKNSRNNPIEYVYAVAVLGSDLKQFSFMSKAEVDATRANSSSKNSLAWVKYYEQMALKTVIRKLINYIPISPLVAEALEHDNRTSFDSIPEQESKLDNLKRIISIKSETIAQDTQKGGSDEKNN